MTGRRLGAAVLLSIMAHVTGFAFFGWQQQWDVSDAHHSVLPGRRALQVSLGSTRVVEEGGRTSVPHAIGGRARALSSISPETAKDEPLWPSWPVISPWFDEGVLDDDLDIYLPAARLDDTPYPLEPVQVPFPETGSLAKQGRLVLRLYVDAEGGVTHVETEQSTLPPEYAQTAASTFRGVRMQPAQKNGQPRRALMRILVEFEAR